MSAGLLASQDPLRQEGFPDGRSSRNIRIVGYDVASGQPIAQVCPYMLLC